MWIRTLIAVTIVTLLAPLSTASQTAESQARQYAEAFMAGDFDTIAPQHSAEMRAGLTRAKAKEIVGQLTGAYGPPSEIGAAWFEDRVAGFNRYRIPIVFAATTLDMRLVRNDSGEVAGLFFVEHTPPPVNQEAPGIEIEIIVGDAERGLPGTLTLPHGVGPFPAVVLVHGSGPSNRDESIGPNRPFRDIAWGMAERGVATLRYDKRSFARPQDLTALGDNVTVVDEVINDAVTALAVLRARDAIDASRIFVAGHSLGGLLAPRIASARPRPSGVILLAGSTLPLPEKMLQQSHYIASADGIVTDEEQTGIDEIEASVERLRAALNDGTSAPGYYLGAPVAYFRDLDAYDGPALLAELDIPALIVQGGRDYQVTMEDFAGWQATLADSPKVCLRVLPAIDHLLREGEGPSTPSDYDVAIPVSNDVLACMADFILSASCCR